MDQDHLLLKQVHELFGLIRFLPEMRKQSILELLNLKKATNSGEDIRERIHEVLIMLRYYLRSGEDNARNEKVHIMIAKIIAKTRPKDVPLVEYVEDLRNARFERT